MSFSGIFCMGVPLIFKMDRYRPSCLGKKFKKSFTKIVTAILSNTPRKIREICEILFPSYLCDTDLPSIWRIFSLIEWIIALQRRMECKYIMMKIMTHAEYTQNMFQKWHWETKNMMTMNIKYRAPRLFSGHIDLKIIFVITWHNYHCLLKATESRTRSSRRSRKKKKATRVLAYFTNFWACAALVSRRKAAKVFKKIPTFSTHCSSPK